MRLLALVMLLFSVPAAAGPGELPGWVVHETRHGFKTLVERVKAATKKNGLFVVTQAGPTGAAKRRGITIPGNRVIGVFNNDFAVKMLRASLNAMIEAPVRLYVTENDDGSATLSYKTPTHVFSPYAEDSPDVVALAARLDELFARIAADAID